MPLSPHDVAAALRAVRHPGQSQDLVSQQLLKRVEVSPDNMIEITIEVLDPAPAIRQELEPAIEHALHRKAAELGERIHHIDVEFTVAQGPQASEGPGGAGGHAAHGGEGGPLPMQGVKYKIAVGAGKGGVGKSTVAVNLAIGLSRTGARVGLLDGDIYGPSLPTMLGLRGKAPRLIEDMLQPFEVHGIRSMTIGSLVEPDKPLIWRGPMAHGAFRQLLGQTNWGPLDYFVIDLPPGTGDVPLTMSQSIDLTGAVVVCTPQQVAQDDARRAVRMFEALGVRVLGVVENMSYFVCEHGTEYDLFGRGGAEQMAREMGLPFLGAIPIVGAMRVNSDVGTPVANFDEDGPLAEALMTITENVRTEARKSGIRIAQGRPSISIS